MSRGSYGVAAGARRTAARAERALRPQAGGPADAQRRTAGNLPAAAAETRRPAPAVHDDLVRRRFVRRRAGPALNRDITEHPTRERKVYLRRRAGRSTHGGSSAGRTPSTPRATELVQLDASRWPTFPRISRLCWPGLEAPTARRSAAGCASTRPGCSRRQLLRRPRRQLSHACRVCSDLRING